MTSQQKLIEDNMNLVYFVIHQKFPRYRNDEDMVQVGMVGLCKAANSWDESKGTFSNFAVNCIYNTMCNEFRHRNRQQLTCSLDYNYSDSDDEPVTLGDMLVGDPDVDWVDLDGLCRGLTEKERAVVDLRRMGLNQREVAEKLGVSQQTINCRLRRIKKRWEKNK